MLLLIDAFGWSVSRSAIAHRVSVRFGALLVAPVLETGSAQVGLECAGTQSWLTTRGSLFCQRRHMSPLSVCYGARCPAFCLRVVPVAFGVWGTGSARRRSPRINPLPGKSLSANPSAVCCTSERDSRPSLNFVLFSFSHAAPPGVYGFPAASRQFRYGAPRSSQSIKRCLRFGRHSLGF